MKNKVILIGAINEGNIPTCGETMKNQLFVKRFSELFDKVITVDTLNWQRRPWVLIKMFLALLFNRNTPIVISASGASRYLIRFLYYFPICKNVCFWVVGGNLVEAIEAGRFKVKELNKLNYVLVQGKSMEAELISIGVTNALYVPNSKPIIYQPAIVDRDFDSPLRFVFLSRIHPDKGIADIVKACEYLNDEGLGDNFLVDFYGKIESNFKQDFETLVNSMPQLQYKGYLDLTKASGYETLSSYDVMLFPTYWNGEGFPGIVIDANIAGLPIIASDWNLNREVVIDGITGVIIPVHSWEALTTAMKDFIVGNKDLTMMKKQCSNYVKQFDYQVVLSRELVAKLFNR
jgi:glycosyltransferase involved in cell wall biosynthesis